MEQAQRAAAAMAEADRHKDEFLALLGHELRNPLVPLSAGLELLRRRMGTLGYSDDAMVRTRLAMDRQVKHLTRLVDDLLDVSRISAGRSGFDAPPPICVTCSSKRLRSVGRPLPNMGTGSRSRLPRNRCQCSPIPFVWFRSSSTCSATPSNTPAMAAISACWLGGTGTRLRSR